MPTESLTDKVRTKLAIVIDPPNQNPNVASKRVDEFIQRGGKAVLIGGSGSIEANIFKDTVEAIVGVTIPYNGSIPVLIFPGHIDQIPIHNSGIKSLLNYRYIMGAEGTDFEQVYPESIRQLVSEILQERHIPSIPTLYILCGDPNASVSRISGIQPLDFTSTSVQNRFLKDTDFWLHKGVECVYLESGSGAAQPVNLNAVVTTRHLIDKLRAEASLFVSGGIKNPSQALMFAGIADFVVVGGHFERNGVKDTSEFVAALKI